MRDGGAGWLLAIAAALAGHGAVAPAGTEIQIRLTSKVASNTSKPKDPVRAMVIVPVIVEGRIVVPAGAKVWGEVKEARPAGQVGERALLDLHFDRLLVGKSKTALEARVAEVDNARDPVEENGQILGMVASETLSARIDQGIAKMSEKYSDLADVLQAAKSAIVKQGEGEIIYPPGVEMALKLAAPLEIPESAAAEAGGPKLDPMPAESALIGLVNGQPFQTMAENPPKPSDVTNIMFIGTQAQLASAFQAAGWSTAAALNAQSKLETARAIIENRGYKEAPVSVQLLEGAKLDLVFQKQNNTFAERHHLRIWRRPVTFQGKPVWVCAATHDTGIEFSEQNRTFIHKIDSQIDRERAKVVNDLLLTGTVKSLALVERPEVPRQSRNATGDDIETDAAMAVLLF